MDKRTINYIIHACFLIFLCSAMTLSFLLINERFDSRIKNENKIYSSNIKPKEKIVNNVNKYNKKVKFDITYTTDLPCENGGTYGTNSLGVKLALGDCSVNGVPLNTNIYCPDLKFLNNSVLVVSGRLYGKSSIPKDREYMRINIYVPRKNGENDRHYLKRVNTYSSELPNETIGYMKTNKKG